MPSTRLRRLSDFLKPFARSSTFDLDTVEVKSQAVRISIAATTADIALAVSLGPVALKAIRFLPEGAITSDATNKWDLTFNKRATADGAATQLGTFTTNGNALTVGKSLKVYNPTAEDILKDGEGVTVSATKGGTAADLKGTFVVEYVSLLDA